MNSHCLSTQTLALPSLCNWTPQFRAKGLAEMALKWDTVMGLQKTDRNTVISHGPMRQTGRTTNRRGHWMVILDQL